MNKTVLRKIFKLALMIAAGLALGYFTGRLVGNDQSEHLRMAFGYKALLFALLLPTILFVIAWHEAGHAVAGLCVGFDFRMYVVGPFLWQKTDRNWQFRWNKNLNIAGGMVLCLPKNNHDLKTNFIWFAAGGPLASLVLAAVAGSIAYFFFPPIAAIQTQGILWAKTLIGAIGIFSFLISLVTIMPLYTGGFYSDGARILRLLRGGEKAKFDMFLFSQIANSTNGLRPKLMDVNTLEEAKRTAHRIKEPFAMYMPGILHQAHLDRNELDSAEAYLLEYISEAPKMPTAIQDMVWLDAAFFYAFARKDFAIATQYWDKFKHSPFVPKAQIWTTEAFLLYLKGDHATALAKKDAALSEMVNMVDKGLAIALKERLEQIN
jgi:hypothetical protein